MCPQGWAEGEPAARAAACSANDLQGLDCSSFLLALENHSPRLMELLPRAKPNTTFSLCVWQPGRVEQPPPAPLLTFIMARCKSSCSGPEPRAQHVFQSFTLLPDSVFQYFALNLLLYLIRPAAAVFHSHNKS